MRPSQASRLVGGLTLCALVLSCGKDSTGVSGGDAVATVTVRPLSSTVDIGQSTQLTATARNARGEVVSAEIGWTSSASDVASVTPSGGLVTGVSAGSAIITASASGRSASAMVTVRDPTPPGAPSDVVAAPVSNTAVDVSWTDNSDNEDEFRVEREAVAGEGAFPAAGATAQSFVQAGVVDADVTTFQDTGLDPSGRYRYRVLACNENGCSEPSETSAEVITYETLVIETTDLPDATENEPYQATLTARGGHGAVAWSLSTGALPPGLSLGEATGVIGGTPTTPGQYDFTVRAQGGGQAVTRALSILVEEEILPPVVATEALPSGVVGASYQASLIATEGDGSYVWHLTSGSLPPGLALTEDGTVTGEPTATGSFAFQVEVTSAGMSGGAGLSIDVFPVLSVTTSLLPSGVIAVAYQHTLAATGGDGSYVWALAEGQLPVGVSLSPGGALSGTPTATGTAEFTVEVTSGDGQTARASLSITVRDEVLPPSVLTGSLPDGGVGAAYATSLQATDGDGTYGWAVTAGALPDGLSLNPVTGQIAGTPTAAGTAAFTVTVTSASLTGSADLSITVHPALAVATASLPDAVEGQPYSRTLVATGGDGTNTWSLDSGSLPDGLTLSGDGTVSGTAAPPPPSPPPGGPVAVTGTSSFTVRVENGLGQSAIRALTLTVNAVLEIVTASLPGGEVGTPYAATLSATGGDGATTWAVVSGSLPDGLGLDAPSGEISGTPTAAGTADFTVRAGSGDGQTAQRALSIQVVSGVVTVTTTSLPDGQLGTPYSQTLTATGGTGSYTWSVTDGTLPDDLTLDPSTGTLSGTPSATGTFGFTVEAASGGQTDDQALSITIAPAPVSIDTDYLATAYPGTAYSDVIEASGGDGSFTFAVTNGSLPDGLALDPATGEISGTGGTSGAYYFTVTATSAGKSASKTYAVAVSTAPAGAFNMGIVNAAGNTIPSAAVVAQLSNTLARWEQVITGDLGDFTYGPGTWAPGSCGGDGPIMNGQTVDDMVILVNLANIDGPGNTLGSAGPCDVRVFQSPVNFATLFGRLTLDTSDLGDLDTHQLFSLFFHEIGHIVGIGTLWSVFHQVGGTDLISGAGTADPRYEGTGGNDVYAGVLGGPSSGMDTRIPIEADGGAGTRDGHWDEGEFDTEIMTGWAEAPGVTQPISQMTIAAVGDFAYTVDPGAADAYALPMCAPFCTAAPPAPGARRILLDDILKGPIRTVLPDGTVLWLEPRRER